MTEIASSARPQLLVSVQNEGEARLAYSLGVQWIDLKNPARGSLGCPDVTTATHVARALPSTPSMPSCQTSVALGELQTLNLAVAFELMKLFPIAKVGLAGLVNETSAKDPVSSRQSTDSAMWKALETLSAGQQSGGQLVLAAYADHQRAASPSPAAVIQLARQLGARFVLIDTFVKDGLGLFHWQSARQIASLRMQAESIGAQLVVAGSLSSADWPGLCEAAPPIIGVRGSVCAHDRASQLCPERIAQWLRWTENNSHRGDAESAEKSIGSPYPPQSPRPPR